MNFTVSLLVVVCGCSVMAPIVSSAQSLSVGDQKIVAAARARYYNLDAAGFVSMTCALQYDFATVPMLAADPRDARTKLLKATKLTVKLDRSGALVDHQFPDGTSAALQQQVAPVLNVLESFAEGLFKTWPSKGLTGPIPPFDTQVQSVETTDAGYTVSLRAPGAPVKVFMDKDYLVSEIVSVGGSLDEHTTYTASPDGLVFSGTRALSKEQDGKVDVAYELGWSVVNGFRVPQTVHLRVNDNVDVKFALEGCVVEKGQVVKAGPPA